MKESVESAQLVYNFAMGQMTEKSDLILHYGQDISLLHLQSI